MAGDVGGKPGHAAGLGQDPGVIESLEQRVLRLAPPITLADACRRNAVECPHGTAVIDTDTGESFDWQTLTRQTDAMAMGFLQHGLRRGDIVLLQSYTCLDTYLARIAMEKAGIRPLAVPLNFRDREISALVRQVQPVAAIMPREYRGFRFDAMLDRLRAEGGPAQGALRLTWAVGEEAVGWPSVRSLAETPLAPGDEEFLERQSFRWFERSHLESTSGSTGKPKCVEKAMYSRALTGWELARMCQLQSDDVVMSLAPIVSGPPECFAYRTSPQFRCPLVLIRRFEAEKAIQSMAKYRVTLAVVVPTMLVRLVRCPDFQAERLPHLRLILSYGSMLSAEICREVERRTRAKIVTAYGANDFGGLTATPVWASADERWTTVGRPLRGNEFRIEKADGSKAAPGEVGEILVRGLHAAGSYVADAAIDRQVWKAGYYRTGDLGRFDGRGNLVLTGRSEDVIIRGGQNIAAGEVEEVLRELAGVADAAVVGMPDEEMGQRICAFLVFRGEEQPDLAQIQEHFRRKGVAMNKCPERLEVVDELPLNASGLKVDKNELLTRLQRQEPAP